MCEICHKYVCPSGCPNAPEPEIMGYCLRCAEELRVDYEYYEDGDGNEFCSEECAIQYHGIKCREWD